MSQRAFDAARKHSRDHADLPGAKRIAELLGLRWRQVLVVAHAPEAEQNKLLATKTREPEQDWLSEEHVAAVLGIVAARLGVDTVSLSEYRVERSRILEENRSRAAFGHELLLPTDEQIMVFVGAWDDALRLAGLRATRERGPTKRGKAPPLPDLMDRFHDEYGHEPSAKALREFARGNGIPYPAARERSAFKTAREEWRKRRHANGLPEAAVVKRAGGRGHKAPDYSRDVGAARPEERRRDRWSREDCVAWVARYVSQLGPGERSTANGYIDWAATQELAPVLSTIKLHGSWESVRREAQQRLAHSARPGKISATSAATVPAAGLRRRR